MAFHKIGENLNFNVSDILTQKQALGDIEAVDQFTKLAKKIKKLAPKADDFLYFHCLMMHAAEAALIDQNTGEPLKNAKGESVKGYFEKFTNKKGEESLKWISPDGIMPYRNANRDIFGEEELIKAHKGWVGKSLCRDHKSDSIDGIRGIIIDTYYDPKYKRLHGLAALDKKNYADLARKVETGYSNSVSMGTGVGRSVCTECGNIAITEKDYCSCVRARKNYGEINLDLSPIELSLVVNGADGLAKVRRIVASMNEYIEQKQVRVAEMMNSRCVNPTELQSLADVISEMQTKINGLMKLEKSEDIEKVAKEMPDVGELVAILNRLDKETDPEIIKMLKGVLENYKQKQKEPEMVEQEKEPTPPQPSRATVGGGSEYTTPEVVENTGAINPANRFANKMEGGEQGAILKEISLLRSRVASMNKSIEELKTINLEEKHMNSARLKARARARRAYWLGGGGVNEPTPGKPKYEKEDADKIRNTEDKQMVGEPLETGAEGLHPGDKEVKEKLLRAELEDRAMKRRAYWLGGGGINEPTPGKPKYEKEEADKIRNTEDKQMTGEPLETGSDGLFPGDKEVKEKLLRAKLRAKFTKVADASGKLVKDASKWDVFAGDKLILTATAAEIYEDEVSDHWDYLSSAQYGKDLIKHIRAEGFDRTAYLLKGAAEPAMPAMPMPEAAAPAAMPLPEAAAPAAPAKGDDSAKINDALNAVEEKLAEVRDLVSGMGSEELVDVGVDEKKTPVEGVVASRDDIMKVEALMDLSADELAEASETLANLDKVAADKQEQVLKAALAAVSDSNEIVAQANIILEAAKKGKKKVKKEKKEEKEDKKEDKKEEKEEDKEECEEEKEEVKEEKEEKKEASVDELRKLRAEKRAELLAKACEMCLEDAMNFDSAMSQLGGEQEWLKHEKEEQKAEDVEVEEEECCSDLAADDKEVVASRKSDRDALVVEATDKILGKYELKLDKADNATEPTFFKAHPDGGTVTELTGTKTPEAKVETIEEVHEVMRDVAESGPRNVREAAAELQEKIVEGALKATDVERLVAEGKVDAAAAAYWKKYFALAGEGGFGADMSKEFAGKKKEADNKVYKVKLRRAYDVGLEAQEKGIIDGNREALDSYVDELMTFDDASFESTKRIVASYSEKKVKNTAMPRVGMDAATKAMEVTASPEAVAIDDLLLKLDWK